MQQKVSNFFRLAKKSLHILFDDGPKALMEAYKERRRFQKSIVPKVGEPLVKKRYDEKLIKFYGTALKAEQIAKSFEAISGPIVLALSQDNYLETNGGVQLSIDKEAQQVIAEGKNFVHIFPYWARKTLDFSKGEAWYGISLNRQDLGFVEEKILLDALKTFLSNKLESTSIHHTMGFRLSFLDEIRKLNTESEAVFWIHDFFTLCPNYFLLRNNLTYCNAPPLSSNACTICSYGSIRPRHLQGFVDFLNKHPLRIVAPSSFALDFWQDKFPLKNLPGELRPHGDFILAPKKHHRKPGQPITVAFLGYPVFHKGWQTWLTLTKTFAKDPGYKFVLFSNNLQTSPYFKSISVTVNAENPRAMVEAMQKNQVDVAFLWSICPETYSFTLQEALEAGAFVITNPYSGNIQKQVKDHHFGVVLEDETTLLSFFSDGGLKKALS